MPDYIVRPATQADRAGIDELLSCSYPPLLAKAYDAQVLVAALPAMTRANPKLLDRNTWFVALVSTSLAAHAHDPRPAVSTRIPMDRSAKRAWANQRSRGSGLRATQDGRKARHR